jgi:hypothetical protein
MSALDREPPRWSATVAYSTDTGPVEVEHFVEEIADLDELIERGPDWNSIERIVVTLTRRRPVTIEEAMQL